VVIKAVANVSKGQTFRRSFIIILIAEAITILTAWQLLDHNVKGWLNARSAQAVKISQQAAAAVDWSQIDKVSTGRASALAASYEDRLSSASDRYFKGYEGSVYLAFLEGSEEYDLYPGTDTKTLNDAGKANQWVTEAYATERTTYSPEPIVDNIGTYLAAYTPIVRNGKVIGLVTAEYDEAPLGDFQSIVRMAFMYSIIPALFASLVVAYILASMFVEPTDVLRAIDQTAKDQLARSLRGEKDQLWESLTPREMEVAELASQGLTYKEIADRLFVGTETVKEHLKNIRTKTGWTKRELGLEAQARRIAQVLAATA